MPGPFHPDRQPSPVIPGWGSAPPPRQYDPTDARWIYITKFFMKALPGLTWELSLKTFLSFPGLGEEPVGRYYIIFRRRTDIPWPEGAEHEAVQQEYGPVYDNPAAAVTELERHFVGIGNPMIEEIVFKMPETIPLPPDKPVLLPLGGEILDAAGNRTGNRYVNGAWSEKNTPMAGMEAVDPVTGVEYVMVVRHNGFFQQVLFRPKKA